MLAGMLPNAERTTRAWCAHPGSPPHRPPSSSAETAASAAGSGAPAWRSARRARTIGCERGRDQIGPVRTCLAGHGPSRPGAGGRGAGRARTGTGGRGRPATGTPDIPAGQVTTPRVRRRTTTSTTTPPAARLNTVTRSAVRMALTTTLAMLTAATVPSTASAIPAPPEVTPLPPHADPGLHMALLSALVVSVPYHLPGVRGRQAMPETGMRGGRA